MAEETGEITGTKDKDYNVIWFVDKIIEEFTEGIHEEQRQATVGSS